MKHEARAMLARGGGSIVNIGSDQSTIAGRNMSAYVSSKHGLVGATRGAAMDDGARGIRVDLVAPGPTDTAQFRSFVREPEAREAFARARVPMQKLGRPEDYGGLVAWLASDAAASPTAASARSTVASRPPCDLRGPGGPSRLHPSSHAGDVDARPAPQILTLCLLPPLAAQAQGTPFTTTDH